MLAVELETEARWNDFQHIWDDIRGKTDWDKRCAETLRDFYDGANFHTLVRDGIFKVNEISFAFSLSTDGFEM
jgi:hypothetical protein